MATALGQLNSASHDWRGRGLRLLHWGWSRSRPAGCRNAASNGFTGFIASPAGSGLGISGIILVFSSWPRANFSDCVTIPLRAAQIETTFPPILEQAYRYTGKA